MSHVPAVELVETVTSARSGLRHAARAFGHRDYRIFWSGALASNVGTWLANLTVPYVLFQLTHSALWVGLASVAQLLPGVFLGPWGGSLADHHERRRVLLVTQSGMAACALALWLLWISGAAVPGLILAVLACSSLFQGLNLPVWQSFVNDLVPRADLGSAVAMNSLQFNAARAIGPALAGAILATTSASWAFGANAASFVGVLVALLAIRTRGRPAPGRTSAGVLRGFRDAIAYVTGQPGIQIAIVLSVLVGFLGNPIFSFTVVFAGDVFHVGALGLGLMNAALGLGCLVAAPLVSGGFTGLTMGRLVRIALPVYGASLLCFALAPHVTVAWPLLVVVGIAFMALISSANTAIQLIVAPGMRGRVISVRIVVFSASMPLGALLQGWVADQVGPRATVAVAGGVLLLAALMLSGVNQGRWMRRLDDPHDEAVPRCGTRADVRVAP